MVRNKGILSENQWYPTPVLVPGKSHGWRSLEGCSPWGCWGSDTTERLHFHFSLSCIGEGNGNPLQCSCLKNPRDGGAWWSAVSGVAQSRTRLKWLRSSSSSENQLLPSMIYYSVLFFQFIPQKSLDIDKRMKHWISYDPKPYYSCQFFILFEAFLTSYFFGY